MAEEIRSRVASQEYRKNWDAVFRKKQPKEKKPKVDVDMSGEDMMSVERDHG